jgi:hypothetical protein
MFTFSASVTRSDLGLLDLDINDLVNYRVSSEIMGSMVTFDRKIVSSPYVNGDVTVHRRRGNVNEKFSVLVYGDEQNDLQINVSELINAFTQNSFNLSFGLDSTIWSYKCEASDYQLEWNNAYFASGQLRVTFNLNRNPIPLVGV